ncbi:MAG: hypothetical protein WCT10_05735 [Patescibacteria group bacterium]|jgi:hypothetical protein
MSERDFGKDLGVMHELAVTGRKVGFGARDWGTLAHDQEKLRQVLFFIRNPQAAAKPLSHIVDCGTDPFTPEGWEVEEHRRSGLIDLAKVKIDLVPVKDQKRYAIYGDEIRKEMAYKPVLNANVLDYLLAHPEIIPKEWKSVCFWGTIYRSGTVRFVRVLSNDGCLRPHWCAEDLHRDWKGHLSPAACLHVSASGSVLRSFFGRLKSSIR